jgi:hypothetical protein
MARKFLSQRLAIVATIDPSQQTTAAVGSTAVDLRRHAEVVFICQTGVLGTSATVDMKLQTGATSSPTTDLSGKSITQLVKASNDNDQVMVGIRRSDLPSGHNFVRALVTVGTAASYTALVGLAEVEDVPAISLSKSTLVQVVNS